MKAWVAVDLETGNIVDVSEGVPVPTADITLLARSGLCIRKPPEGSSGGDKGYAGIDKLYGDGATPWRTPRGREQSEDQKQSEEDKSNNRAFARERIVVEHGVRRVRRYECLSWTDRCHRAKHTKRAVVGLVTRRLDRQQRCRAA